MNRQSFRYRQNKQQEKDGQAKLDALQTILTDIQSPSAAVDVSE